MAAPNMWEGAAESMIEQEPAANIRCVSDETFVRWYKAHGRRIRSLCLRIVRDEATAEDIVQETLLRAWMRRSSLREPELGAWLSVVARNLCLNTIRNGKKAVLVDRLPDYPDDRSDPAADLERKETESNVRLAMAGIARRDTRVLYLREVEGLEYNQLGSELGLTAEGVRTVAFRARALLRERLRSLGEGLSAVIVGIRVRVRQGLTKGRRAAASVDGSMGSALQTGVNLALALGVTMSTFGSVAASIGHSIPMSATTARRTVDVRAAHKARDAAPIARTPFDVEIVVGGRQRGPVAGLPKPGVESHPHECDGTAYFLLKLGDHQLSRLTISPQPGDGFDPLYELADEGWRPVGELFGQRC